MLRIDRKTQIQARIKVIGELVEHVYKYLDAHPEGIKAQALERIITRLAWVLHQKSKMHIDDARDWIRVSTIAIDVYHAGKEKASDTGLYDYLMSKL